RSFVSEYVGAGVSAGIVLDGHVFSGTQGFSGEIGHCVVTDDGPTCVCGLRGCLEELISDRAIVRAVQGALDKSCSPARCSKRATRCSPERAPRWPIIV
ncbi:MAG TPA: ROK family protein, partial [Polyangiaceae bacterium]|nr:ROK family protein [Polyangiaceae bacterium]